MRFLSITRDYGGHTLSHVLDTWNGDRVVATYAKRKDSDYNAQTRSNSLSDNDLKKV